MTHMKYRKHKVKTNISPDPFEMFGETFRIFGESFQNFSQNFENDKSSDISEKVHEKVFVTKLGKTILIRNEDVFINGKKIEENVPEKSFSEGKENVLMMLIGGVIFLVTMFLLCYFKV